MFRSEEIVLHYFLRSNIWAARLLFLVLCWIWSWCSAVLWSLSCPARQQVKSLLFRKTGFMEHVSLNCTILGLDSFFFGSWSFHNVVKCCRVSEQRFQNACPHFYADDIIVILCSSPLLVLELWKPQSAFDVGQSFLTHHTLALNAQVNFNNKDLFLPMTHWSNDASELR